MSARLDIPQEDDHVDRTRLLAIGVGAIVVTVVAVLVADALLRTWGATPPSPIYPSNIPRQIGTVDQRLLDDTERGRTLRADQRASLERWRWLDRDAGLAEIPIDVAMDIVAAKEKRR
jgi:hypothetical protein